MWRMFIPIVVCLRVVRVDMVDDRRVADFVMWLVAAAQIWLGTGSGQHDRSLHHAGVGGLEAACREEEAPADCFRLSCRVRQSPLERHVSVHVHFVALPCLLAALAYLSFRDE